ncbi:Mariner Mos1 transposase [Eumeta japonica]|uniref:Mariner Mos1 transposase n=1 Tax=Eumeta variegata TaxID=151549 RepID=A0A4C1T0H1_EUMVA|nr:Mariner Mos1 transposase [Eumeta japonica]
MLGRCSEHPEPTLGKSQRSCLPSYWKQEVVVRRGRMSFSVRNNASSAGVVCKTVSLSGSRVGSGQMRRVTSGLHNREGVITFERGPERAREHKASLRSPVAYICHLGRARIRPTSLIDFDRRVGDDHEWELHMSRSRGNGISAETSLIMYARIFERIIRSIMLVNEECNEDWRDFISTHVVLNSLHFYRKNTIVMRYPSSYIINLQVVSTTDSIATIRVVAVPVLLPDGSPTTLSFKDAELDELLEEDSSQTQKELALTLEVTQQAVSHRLKSLRMIYKQSNWVPYELKTRDVERRLCMTEMLLARHKKKVFYIELSLVMKSGYIMIIQKEENHGDYLATRQPSIMRSDGSGKGTYTRNGHPVGGARGLKNGVESS